MRPLFFIARTRFVCAWNVKYVIYYVKISKYILLNADYVLFLQSLNSNLFIMIVGKLLDFFELPFDEVLRIYLNEVERLYKCADDVFIDGVCHFMSLKALLDCGILTKDTFRNAVYNYFCNFYVDYDK